ncbi:hypothetical protein Q5P01_023932 [Channa striata]|uniref:Uncharacterized protein n=1 Tax=Channa striata TaxID=64152 RepID=A0AA88JAV1_CHASR|nr:hypothetical protein Q5P01_023932 [Channa striata]
MGPRRRLRRQKPSAEGQGTEQEADCDDRGPSGTGQDAELVAVGDGRNSPGAGQEVRKGSWTSRSQPRRRNEFGVCAVHGLPRNSLRVKCGTVQLMTPSGNRIRTRLRIEKPSGEQTGRRDGARGDERNPLEIEPEADGNGRSPPGVELKADD